MSTMPMSWGTKTREHNEVLCVFCNNSVTTGHHPPTLKPSTTSPVLDPARTKRLPITLVKQMVDRIDRSF